MKRSFKLGAMAVACAAGVMVSAGAANFTSSADRLHEVGLFQGTGMTASGAPQYDLDRAPTRAEAAVMLVRLLGKEADAKALTYTAPFTDLEGWEAPYVQYLYDKQADYRRNRDHLRAEGKVFCSDVHHLPAAFARLLRRAER